MHAKERNTDNFSDAGQRSSDAKSRNFEHVAKAESIKSDRSGEAVFVIGLARTPDLTANSGICRWC